MIGLRRPFWTQLGASLAGLALSLQLMLAGTGLLQRAPSADRLVDIFGEHALCLASGGTTAPNPVPERSPSDSTHHQFGFCCLWHAVPAIQPTAAQLPRPVVYGNIIGIDRRDEPTGARAWQSPHNARGPPLIV